MARRPFTFGLSDSAACRRTSPVAVSVAPSATTASTPAMSRRRRRRSSWYPRRNGGTGSNAPLLLVASALLLVVASPPVAAGAAAAGAAEPPPPPPQQHSPYTSITALNKYGNSAQLQNALLASTRQSPSLVVACLAGGGGAVVGDGSGGRRELDSVVVCSSHRPRPGVAAPRYWGDAPGAGGVATAAASSSAGRAVHVVASDDHSGDGRGPIRAITGVAFAGVRADARLLLSLLREHARRSWERYDSVPGAGSTSRALGEVLLTFMGYRRDRELHDGAGPVAPDGDGEEEESFDMARPFGVQSLVVGIGGVAPGPAEIFAVDPSGVTEACVARAIGRGSDEANELLERRWRRGMTIAEAAEMCGGVVREVVAGRGADGGTGPSTDVPGEQAVKGYNGDRGGEGERGGAGWAIVCEALCPRDGLTVMSRRPLHSGDEEGGQEDSPPAARSVQ